MNTLAIVKDVFIKTQHGQPMSRPEDNRITLLENRGIQGDINADPISPRQILLLGISTLERFQLTPGDLKENILVEGLNLDAVPSGAALAIGEDVVLRVTLECETCEHITRLQRSAKELRGQRGILATVVCGGQIKVGDKVELKPISHEPLAAEPYERFLWLLKKIPVGKVLTYAQIVRAIGVTKRHIRIIPSYIKRTSPQDYPVQRITDTRGRLIPHLNNQKSMLEHEGVPLVEREIVSETAFWQPENLFS